MMGLGENFLMDLKIQCVLGNEQNKPFVGCPFKRLLDSLILHLKVFKMDLFELQCICR